MGATTVSGTILGVDNAPRVGVYVYFRLKTTGTDSVATSTIDATRISAVTDANGQFSTTLWDNGDSGVTSIMEIQMPSGQRHDVIIPAADAAIDVWDLIENYTVGTADPQLPVNESLFMRKANNLSDVASPSTSRTNLGVAIGSNVQAWSAVLDATTASFLIADETKLDGIEALADVTDATNVAAAGAHMAGGTDIPIADGGTGASTATAARTNLGVAIGTDVQAYNAVLDATTASFTTADETKLDGIEALADVTDATNVAAAGGYITGGADVAIADGGTGASDAATARTNLGIDSAISTANAAGNQGKQVIRSATFPTTSDFLSVADDATLDVGTGDFSIFFTARIDSDSSTESVMYKYGGGVGYQVRFVSGALQLILNDGVEDVFSLATGMNDDQWHVYIIAVDRDGNATAYIDNVAQTPVDVSSAALTLDNTGQLQIGLNGVTNPLANGAMASYVGLTKDLITAAEVADASFDTTRLKDLSNLSLCVDMASLQIDTFIDRSSNNHTVTVNGVPSYNDDRGDLTVSNSTIIVRKAADLSGTLVSDKTYLIDGIIDMGTQTITVPSGGLEIGGFGLSISSLISTENSYTMFVDAASDAGTLFITDITIDVSGTSSKVFDLDNSGALGAVEMNTVNFFNCTSLGTLDAYRQFLMSNIFMNNCADGITFAGTWAGGASIQTFLCRNFGSTGTVFTGSTSPALTFGSRFICNGNINVPSGATVYDFAASMFTNDADFELLSGEYTGAGTVVAVKSPVIDNTSTKSRFRNNNGLENTYVGGKWTLPANTNTTTTLASTYYKVSGTTTPTDLQWMSDGDANDLTYDSAQNVRAVVSGSASISSGANNTDVTLKLVQLDASNSFAEIDLQEMPVLSLKTAGDALQVPIVGYADLAAGDIIELQVQSNSAGAVLTFYKNLNVAVSQRSN